jgi:hypothetical protein
LARLFLEKDRKILQRRIQIAFEVLQLRIHLFSGKKGRAVVEPAAEEAVGPFAKPRCSLLLEDLIELAILAVLPGREEAQPLREFLEEFAFSVSRIRIAKEFSPTFQVRSRLKSPFFAII